MSGGAAFTNDDRFIAIYRGHGIPAPTIYSSFKSKFKKNLKYLCAAGIPAPLQIGQPGEISSFIPLYHHRDFIENAKTELLN